MVSEVRHWLEGRGSHSAGQNGPESSPKLEKEGSPASRRRAGRRPRLWVSRETGRDGVLVDVCLRFLFLYFVPEFYVITNGIEMAADKRGHVVFVFLCLGHFT